MVKDNIFGKQLRAARKKKGWSLEKVAEKMVGKQSKQNISNWERGVCNPGYEIKTELQEILEFSIENERKTNMTIKPLIEIETLEETEEAINTIIQNFNIQSQRREYLDDILKKILWLMIGYYRYIVDANEKKISRESGWEYQAPEWCDIAGDLKELIDYNLDRYERELPFIGQYPISIKIHAIIFKIGGELFEDFDEDGYRCGYVQQVAREGESCGYDLISLLPLSMTETDTTMEIRYAILKFSEYMKSI